ncbi:hypothetical protein BS78_01G252400 [Paspalum vaginatum]|nr:hypothetical protein BS78_01G252400 [Paspalum vaginatum]
MCCLHHRIRRPAGVSKELNCHHHPTQASPIQSGGTTEDLQCFLLSSYYGQRLGCKQPTCASTQYHPPD